MYLELWINDRLHTIFNTERRRRIVKRDGIYRLQTFTESNWNNGFFLALSGGIKKIELVGNGSIEFDV